MIFYSRSEFGLPRSRGAHPDFPWRRGSLIQGGHLASNSQCIIKERPTFDGSVTAAICDFVSFIRLRIAGSQRCGYGLSSGLKLGTRDTAG